MTVCVAVCVHDGVVFAADSAATMIMNQGGQSVVTNVYRHGNKVFNLCKGIPIVAMTAGMASIGDAGIHTLAKDFRKQLRKDGAYKIDESDYSIEDVAKKARAFLFEEKYQASPLPPPHSLEFWIGGYSAVVPLPEIWKVTVVNGACEAPAQIAASGASGVFWGGSPEPIQRLIVGFDQELEKALLAAAVPRDEVPKLLEMVRARSVRYLSDARMPIQDAIDLAQYLVDTTKGYFRFLPGADIVGGDTDIAVVTRHERFKWIKRKHFYPQSLNPMETDHDHG